jgi:hypothetical protein
MKNIKQPRCFKFVLAFALAAFAVLPAGANELIDAQQRELKQAQPVWTAQKIPVGMPKAEGTSSTRGSGTRGVSLFARDVEFLVVDDIGFNIENLAASFEPLNPEEPVNLDDPRQFLIRVHSGEVVIPPKALTALFNKHLLDYSPRPLSELTINTGKDSLVAKGGLKLWNWFPGVWLPVHLDGNVTLDEQNHLVYTPDTVKVLGIPLGGLLRALGIKLSWLLSLEREGAQLVANQLVLDHKKVFPPPALEGMIQSASLNEAGLRLKFNDNHGAKFMLPPSAPGSFIWIQSGDVKLFNIVVINANILIMDENKTGNLRFDLYDYRRVIAAKNVLRMQEDGTLIATLSTQNQQGDK